MERDDKIDFYKGLLMFGVIWGHTITALSYQHEPAFIHQFVRLYDMPFFMILSGFFLSKSIRKYPVEKIIINKFTQIFFPTIIWSLICSKFHSITEYYFLYSIFLSSLIVLIVDLICKNRYFQWIVFLIIIFALNCIDKALWNMSYLFPFFVAGFMGGWEKQYKMYFVFPAFVISVCFWESKYTIWNTGSNMFGVSSAPPIVLYRYLIGFLGIITMRNIFGLLKDTPIFSYFTGIGKETLALYLIQAIIIERCLGHLCRYFLSCNHPFYILNNNVMAYVVAPLISIIAMSSFMCIIKSLKKRKQTAWLFGFKCQS